MVFLVQLIVQCIIDATIKATQFKYSILLFGPNMIAAYYILQI